MNDESERLGLMQRDGLLVGIAGLSLANGMHFSPFFDPAFLLMRMFAPAFFVTSPVLIFYVTALFLSLATLIAAGIPAALFERVTGRATSDTTSLLVWLACLIPLSLPALLRLAGG